MHGLPIHGLIQPLRIAPPLRAEIRRRLLRWYRRCRRDLPWRRRQHDAYSQWVAEIMLQQTRVETVLAYYPRFLNRFPNVGALAAADHEQVLKCWEGLGYYRRALHLHRAARLLHHHRQTLPSTAKELQRLPGVGSYTAAAIASIAFQEAVAAVDGNVARVLTRLFNLRDDAQSKEGKARRLDLANQLLSRRRPGDFNQAWMDLGSAICTPRSPKCPRCPLRSVCVTADPTAANGPPVRAAHRKRSRLGVAFVAGIFVNVNDGTMLVRRRPTGGLWSGLWEFPNRPIKGPTTASRYLTRLKTSLEQRNGKNSQTFAVLGRAKKAPLVHHELSHRSLQFHIYVVTVERCRSGSVKSEALRWVTPRGFKRLAVSRAHRNIFEAARTILQHPRLTA